MKALKWILLAVAVLVIAVVVVLVAFKLISGRRPSNNSTQISQFIQADFIDLSKIYSISKFRSGSGHDFSGSGETCRSMKHYFVPQMSDEGQRLRDQNNGLPPQPDGKTDIDIFSPVDGKITNIQKEQMPIGEQIYITPDNASNFTVRLFHIYKSDGMKKGVKVKAGQKIGVISQYSTTDIAVQSGGYSSGKYVSYFDVMPDSIFAKYQDRGVKNRSDLIISKEVRDAKPLECNGESFAVNYDSDAGFGNYFYLSGAIQPSNDNRSGTDNSNRSN